MRFVCLSDTHSLHRKIKVPSGDVLIHCGDFCHFGTKEELIDFEEWFQNQPHTFKLLVSGNHDDIPWNFLKIQNLVYSKIMIEDISISGIPYPLEINENFIISQDFYFSQILISHENSKEDLEIADIISKMLNLKIHISGHNHEEYGWYEKDGIIYAHISMCNSDYKLIKEPFQFDYDGKNAIKIIE
jgi:predicted phosphodiesterase